MQLRTTRRLNTAKEQAKELNISLRHLANLKAKRLIPFIKMGHCVRFDPAAVERALAKLTVEEVG